MVEGKSSPQHESELGSLRSGFEDVYWHEVRDLPLNILPKGFGPLANSLRLFWLTKNTSLALAEMYWVLAVLFRPAAPELELFETVEADVVPVRDYVGGVPEFGTKGVRVRIE